MDLSRAARDDGPMPGERDATEHTATTRRRALQTAAVAASLPVVGCLGDDGPVTETRTVEVDELTATPRETPTAYGEDTLARRTPDASVLDQPGVAAGRRRGAATDRLVATRDGERVAVADFSLGVYEAPIGADREEFSYDLYWLWTAARTTAEATRLSELVSHVRLGGETDLTVYGVTDAGETGAGVLREQTGTDDDEFALRWRGETTETAA